MSDAEKKSEKGEWRPLLPLRVVEGANYYAVMLFDRNARQVAKLDASRSVAEFMALACNAHDALVEALKKLVAADDGGWATRHAAENSYCPDCAKESDAWHDQKEHHPGCAYIARMESARAALKLAEPAQDEESKGQK